MSEVVESALFLFISACITENVQSKMFQTTPGHTAPEYIIFRIRVTSTGKFHWHFRPIWILWNSPEGGPQASK